MVLFIIIILLLLLEGKLLVSLNWSQNSQAFYVDNILVNLIATNNGVSPFHDFLHCILHALGILDLRQSFNVWDETKAVILADCFRYTLMLDVVSINYEQMTLMARSIAANLIYLTSRHYYNIQDSLIKILMEVYSKLNNSKLLSFYINEVKSFLLVEKDLKKDGFYCVIDTNDSEEFNYISESFDNYCYLLFCLLSYVIYFVQIDLSNNSDLIPIFVTSYA